MARPIYPHELTDPDFQWLVSTYRETHPHAVMIDSSCLPVVLIACEEAGVRYNTERTAAFIEDPVPPTADDLVDLADEQDV